MSFRLLVVVCVAAFSGAQIGRAALAKNMIADASAAGDFPLVTIESAATIWVDSGDAKVAQIAAALLADDIERVTGHKPAIEHAAGGLSKDVVIVGTIGHSSLVDALIQAGKLDVSKTRGQWESSLLAVVDQPFPGVDRALVIAGSDRRGTAYGVVELSEQIGVSPWYWWADVKPVHRDSITIKAGTYEIASPSVKYRGFFINDEDFGLEPWAAKTFDPKFGNIGPKTYEKVFELMLRLRANYLWPAMHPCSTEFGAIDDNVKLADDWGIVMGASHAEPMNRNNVHWDVKKEGEWRYDTNRDAIMRYWEEWATKRGPYEAVWTVGLRGIHDSPMNGPKDVPSRVKLVEQAILDQRALLEKHVGKKADEIPQAFTPYKEVLPLYQAGLKVPDDVTLVWPDDNHGYIRALSTPAEQQRSGGAGVYYHLSYWGAPNDYLWLETTSPALIWEEMSKAYDHGARTIWVVNVGDIKPGEIGTEFFLRLAWDVKAWDETCQMKYLTDWATRNFGKEHAAEIAAVMDEYYRLNYAVRPEHLESAKFTNAYDERADRLSRFENLADRASKIETQLPAELRDAYYETILYSVRCSTHMNIKFLCDNADIAVMAYEQIQTETKHYNEEVAGGKWRNVISSHPRDLKVFQKPAAAWTPSTQPGAADPAKGYFSIEAEKPARWKAQAGLEWKVIPGLGRTGDSIALLPTTATPSNESELDYDFSSPAISSASVRIYCIPTHAIERDSKLRYAVSIDAGAEAVVDIDTKEFSREWGQNVLHATAMSTTKHELTGGTHTLTLRPIDPGLVFDKVVIDFGGVEPSYLGPPANH